MAATSLNPLVLLVWRKFSRKLITVMGSCVTKLWPFIFDSHRFLYYEILLANFPSYLVYMIISQYVR